MCLGLPAFATSRKNIAVRLLVHRHIWNVCVCVCDSVRVRFTIVTSGTLCVCDSVRVRFTIYHLPSNTHTHTYTRTRAPALHVRVRVVSALAKQELEQILCSGMDEVNMSKALVGLGMRGVYGGAVDILSDIDDQIDLENASITQRCAVRMFCCSVALLL